MLRSFGPHLLHELVRAELRLVRAEFRLVQEGQLVHHQPVRQGSKLHDNEHISILLQPEMQSGPCFEQSLNPN